MMRRENLESGGFARAANPGSECRAARPTAHGVWACLVAWLMCCLGWQCTVAQAVEEAPVFQQAAARLQSLLTDFDALSFTFRESRYNAKDSLIWRSEGQAMVARPNLVRWETTDPFRQLLISDGEGVWLYDPDLEQATRRALDSELEDSPALLLGGDLARLSAAFLIEEIRPEAAGEEDELLYRLTPRRGEERFFQAVEIRFRDGLPINMNIRDGLGRRTTLAFHGVIENPILASDAFRFEPPPGTDVIDGLQSQPLQPAP